MSPTRSYPWVVIRWLLLSWTAHHHRRPKCVAAYRVLTRTDMTLAKMCDAADLCWRTDTIRTWSGGGTFDPNSSSHFHRNKKAEQPSSPSKEEETWRYLFARERPRA